MSIPDKAMKLKDGKIIYDDLRQRVENLNGTANEKADKVDNATSGNFAALDGNGNLIDSGHKHSDYLTNHQDISGKANISDLATVATSGSYNDLTNKPIIPTAVSDLTDDSGHYTKPVSGIPASDLAAGVLDVWSGLTYHTSTMSTDSDSFVLGGATDAPTEINKCLVTSTPDANVIPKFDYQGRLHSVTPEEEWDGSNAVATTAYVDTMITNNMPEVPTNVSELNNDAGYLTSFTEIDPTVPNWAKQAQKPSYTAQEIGALPNNTFIPTKVSDLQNDRGYLTEHQDISGKADKTEIPTLISELQNDVGYLTSYSETDPTVPAWAKALTKPTYTAAEVGAITETEVDQKITAAIGNTQQLGVEIVQTLPTENIKTHTIYFVSKTGSTNDVYNEYMYLNNNWEIIGSTQVDLTNYALKSEIPSVPTNIGAFTNDVGYITGYTETDPTVPSWAKATSKPTYTASEVGALPANTVIPSKMSDLTNDAGYITGYTETDPTVPSWAKAATKPTYTASEVGALPSDTVIPTVPTIVSAFTNDAGYLTQHQDISGKADTADLATVAFSGDYDDLQNKPSIPSVPVQDVQVNGTSVLLSGTANIPIASSANAGVVKINNNLGIVIGQSGEITTRSAASNDIKQGTDWYRPITSYYQHESAFYGLAKAAGDSTQAASDNAVGTYTAGAKAAIQTMLDVPSTSNVPTKVSDLTDDSGHYTKPSGGIPASDLADTYVKPTDYATSDTGGVVKVASNGGLYMSSGLLLINRATDEEIKDPTNTFKPIVSTSQHKAVFYGLAKAAGDTTQASSSNTLGIYTNDAKAAIQSMLGISNLIAPSESTLVASKAYSVGDIFTANGKIYKVTTDIVAAGTIVTQDDGETVSGHNAIECKIADYAIHDVQINGTSTINNGVVNIPLADSSHYGVAKIDYSYGVGTLNGFLAVSGPADSDIQTGSTTRRPILPAMQHKAVFYGLAKAAGDVTQSASSNAVGTYTDDAKEAIKAMLGIEADVVLTGASQTITASMNTSYLCGELASLNFTPSSSCICEVIFTSGTTKTVLTLPNTVKMPDWWTDTEPNRIYDIMIRNGTLGMVTSWPT